MPAGTRVSVKASTRSNFSYGFITRLDTDDQTALGHVPVAGALAAGVVFGANSPKPARMAKTKASGRTNSGFVDAASRATATAAGWKLTKRARAKGRGGGAFSKTVYVLFETGTGAGAVNIKYAWNMPLTLYNAIVGADRTALGITDVAAADDAFDLVFGAYPKPSRAYKKGADSIISTFVKSDATLPTGWSFVGGEEE